MSTYNIPCMHTCTAVSPEGSVEVQVVNNSVFLLPSETVILNCIASGGPNNTFEWLLDGGSIENETTATLTLNQVIGAEYTCRVSNAAGSGNASITIAGKQCMCCSYHFTVGLVDCVYIYILGYMSWRERTLHILSSHLYTTTVDPS